MNSDLGDSLFPDSPTTPEMVQWGFRLVLGRELDDPAEDERCVTAFPTLRILRHGLLASAEFERAHGVTSHVVRIDAREFAMLQRLEIPRNAPKPGYFHDFLGLRTSLAFLPGGHDWLDGTMLPIPADNQPFFHDHQEWSAMLRAAAEAEPRGQFSVMELGAGWGPWVSAAARLADLLGMGPARLTAVEADDGKIAFLRSHFAENGLDLSACRIVHGIAGAEDGHAWFPDLENPALHYGLSASFDAGAGHRPGFKRMKSYSLATLLQDEPIVDLIHFDIQGAEAETVAAGLAALTAKVRRILVGTHGRAIEERLFASLSAAGWLLEDDLACRMLPGRQLGEPVLLHADGLQVWSNPALNTAD